jgi:hypothetical protein
MIVKINNPLGTKELASPVEDVFNSTYVSPDGKVAAIKSQSADVELPSHSIDFYKVYGADPPPTRNDLGGYDITDCDVGLINNPIIDMGPNNTVTQQCTNAGRTKSLTLQRR